MLQNVVLTNNWAGSGGGAAEATLKYCLVANNWAVTNGGGTLNGSLYSCVLTRNRAANGGGSNGSALANCTVAGNLATNDGGGLVEGRSFNTIIYYNTSLGTAPNYSGDYAYFSYSCSPDPGGTSSITNEPLFMDPAGGDFCLQSSSPCINAGYNYIWVGATDMDGNPRIAGGTVDIGAYECQLPPLLDYYLWLQGYGLSTASSDTYADSDGDGMNNWQEWLADTEPTNVLSCFHIEAISMGSSATIWFQSSSNRAYTLWRTTAVDPPDWSALSGQEAIPGTGDTLTLSNPANAPQQFYRVQVNIP
jgi:hypothetical protein